MKEVLITDTKLVLIYTIVPQQVASNIGSSKQSWCFLYFCALSQYLGHVFFWKCVSLN